MMVGKPKGYSQPGPSVSRVKNSLVVMNASNTAASGESLPESSEAISVDAKPLVKKSSKAAGIAAWVMLFFLVMIKLCNQ